MSAPKLPASQLTVEDHFICNSISITSDEIQKLWQHIDEELRTMNWDNIEETCARINVDVYARARKLRNYSLGGDVKTEATLR